MAPSRYMNQWEIKIIVIDAQTLNETISGIE